MHVTEAGKVYILWEPGEGLIHLLYNTFTVSWDSRRYGGGLDNGPQRYPPPCVLREDSCLSFTYQFLIEWSLCAKDHVTYPSSTRPQNSVLSKRDFVDVIKLRTLRCSRIIQMGLQCNQHCSYKRETEEDLTAEKGTEMWWLEHWSDALWRGRKDPQVQEAEKGHSERKRQRIDSPPGAAERKSVLLTPWFSLIKTQFGLPASRNVRKYIFLVLKH